MLSRAKNQRVKNATRVNELRKDKKLIKKQTYTKTETCKLYSKVF